MTDRGPRSIGERLGNDYGWLTAQFVVLGTQPARRSVAGWPDGFRHRGRGSSMRSRAACS
ncbi:MAG: hypothetical protein R3A46_19890 [Thermomicrobiales bacterium]